MISFAFEAQRSDFSLINALACARVSHLAYGDDAMVSATARDWGFDGVKPLTRGSNFAIALCNREIVLVAFRGTDKWNDWLTNLNIFYKRSPLGFVHRGFMKAAVSFWPNLAQQIRNMRDNDQCVWFTGHSLGGALAVLASVKAHFEDGISIAGVYTFGQPPIGTTSFGLGFEKRSPYRLYRFINHTDAVSSAPIITLLEHVGEVRYFDTAGILWEGEPPWRVSLADHVRAPGLHGGLSQFKAHLMKDYVDLIAAKIGA